MREELEGKVFYRLVKVLFWYVALVMCALNFTNMESWSAVNVGCSTGSSIGQVLIALLVCRTVLYVTYGRRTSK